MSHLPNYLRSHRKRLQLSQEEIGFLIGAYGAAKVSRYEQFTRLPNLKTALALEVIFCKPASELFAGIHRRVKNEVHARVKTLLYKTDNGKPEQRISRKHRALMAIIND